MLSLANGDTSLLGVVAMLPPLLPIIPASDDDGAAFARLAPPLLPGCSGELVYAESRENGESNGGLPITLALPFGPIIVPELEVRAMVLNGLLC